jgi:hypothetical protein
MSVDIRQAPDSSLELVGNASTGGPGWLPVTINYVATTPDCTFFVADRAYVVKAIRSRVDVAGTGGACTAQIRKTPTATAPASGTVLHTGSHNLVGTANANQALTLSTTASDLLLAVGDALSYDLTGTATSAVGSITVHLAPA